MSFCFSHVVSNEATSSCRWELMYLTHPLLKLLSFQRSDFILSLGAIIATPNSVPPTRVSNEATSSCRWELNSAIVFKQFSWSKVSNEATSSCRWENTNHAIQWLVLSLFPTKRLHPVAGSSHQRTPRFKVKFKVSNEATSSCRWEG